MPGGGAGKKGDIVVTWKRLVPILPARDVAATAVFYRTELGFDVVATDDDYGVLRRGPSEVHLWGPSGIEPAASDTMLRVEVDDVDALYDDCRRRSLVHPNGSLISRPWGTREFSITDLDGNLITFFTQDSDHGV